MALTELRRKLATFGSTGIYVKLLAGTPSK
jgi:hypothetical protein